MNATAKLLAFSAALFVGAFAAVYRYHGAMIDAYLYTSQLHVMDWVLLFFGSACVGGIPYSFFKQPDTFDWRGVVWVIIGGAMIYAVLGDDPQLKETTCRMLSRHHGAWSTPCYQ